MADLKTRIPRGLSAPDLGALGRAARPRALWRQHRLMTIAVLVSLVPRILAALSFRPALLTADSFLYMSNAVTHTLGNIQIGRAHV